jgi:HD-GYP domain-containing protein (c-di-GMP phosphodiesterase class II)
MRTVTSFPLFALPGGAQGPIARVLAELGLEARPLDGAAPPEGPALLLVGPDQHAPEAWQGRTLELPPEASASALAAMLRLAMENAVLRSQLREMEEDANRFQRQFHELNRIGVALSSERDMEKLQDLILSTCRRLTKADGASLWLLEGEGPEQILRFSATQSLSLTDEYRSFTIPLNERSMVGYTIISGTSQLLDDAYNLPPSSPYGWGGRSLDEQHGYRTRSMLSVPMRNHTGEVVGAIQLVNAKRHHDTLLTLGNAGSEIVSFSPDDVQLMESIASQAAVALDNKQLLDSIQALFEGFVKASVTAIESRDPTTYGHSGRVAALTVGIAEAVNTIGAGRFREMGFSADQLKELRYAALLHDFGKVGVREHVLVKEKKLYPAQIDFIRARFAFVQRSAQLQHAEEKLRLAMEGRGDPERFAEIDRRLANELTQLQEWLDAILTANEPSILDEDKASMLAFLSQRMYEDIQEAKHPLLQPEEFHFLSIKKGTLDEKERLEIESHVSHSYRFLTKIPWTPAMRDIPKIAHGHHEKLDGSGYPRRLKGPDIPVQTRMMTISDIYDALTATDRPYKRAVPVERALAILKMEADEGKLDADLLDVFITKRVYEAADSYRPDEDLLLGAGVR